MNIQDQFDTIYEQHKARVYKLCLGYASGDTALAKDWLQEVFIKVWKHRKSFKGDSSISTWIYRITVNTCLSDLRKSQRTVPFNQEIILKDNESKAVDQATQIHKMYQCIDQLTAQNKTLILLELEEILQVDIAATVGIAHGALRTRLSRIRKSLLKCITNGKR